MEHLSRRSEASERVECASSPGEDETMNTQSLWRPAEWKDYTNVDNRERRSEVVTDEKTRMEIKTVTNKRMSQGASNNHELSISFLLLCSVCLKLYNLVKYIFSNLNLPQTIAVYCDLLNLICMKDDDDKGDEENSRISISCVITCFSFISSLLARSAQEFSHSLFSSCLAFFLFSFCSFFLCTFSD